MTHEEALEALFAKIKEFCADTHSAGMPSPGGQMVQPGGRFRAATPSVRIALREYAREFEALLQLFGKGGMPARPPCDRCAYNCGPHPTLAGRIRCSQHDDADPRSIPACESFLLDPAYAPKG